MKMKSGCDREVKEWRYPVFGKVSCLLGVLALVLIIATDSSAAFSLVMTNGYGDVYRMNLMRDRYNYQVYRGVCRYRGFAMAGCSTTGEVTMLRIKPTSVMPEHYSILSTSMRWGTTKYVLNDVFRWLNSWTMYGYENWYPNNMSCSVAMYISSGGFSLNKDKAAPNSDPCGGPGPLAADLSQEESMPTFRTPFTTISPDSDPVLDLTKHYEQPANKAWSLVLTNGYGDIYRMNLVRDRYNYQAYRGVCRYRGFAMAGCSTTGEVVMLRIKPTTVVPEHYSLVSTSMRWGKKKYFLNDVFRWLNSWTMYGYENWYPNNMSCSVAFYISSGGFSLRPRAGPKADRTIPFDATRGSGTTNVIGALVPLTGDLADMGLSYQAAYNIALGEITNMPGMPAIQLEIKDTRTDAGYAHEQLEALYAEGVRIVLGPETSQECAILRDYAEQNNILLISSSSTASQLAITNDNLMRLTIDDSQQARALAQLIHADGITDIAILLRTDMYGDGLRDSLIAEFTALGGTVFSTNYCPRASDFIGETVTNVGATVATHLLSTSADKVGFVTILFDEGVDVMHNAASVSALSSIRWYGTDGMAQNSSLLTNAAAVALAKQTRFVCSAFGSFTNQLYGVVESNIQVQVGSATVPRYPMSAYDALWLTALALGETGGTQTVATLKAMIRSVATNYSGATGPIVFNGADDRSTGSYNFWQFTDVNGSNEWVNISESLPDAPANVSASDGEYIDKVRVLWNSVSGSTGYELWRGTNDNAESGSLISELSGTSYDDTSVGSGATYYYRVKATNSLGTSGFSDEDGGWRRSAASTDIAGNDFDGDGKSDVAVYEDSSGYWYILPSSTYSLSSQKFGSSGCTPVNGDFDGDGKSDVAVYEDSSGYWYILPSSTYSLSSQKFGSSGCTPVQGDYDGDGKSDVAVYQESSGYWYILSSSTYSLSSQKFGSSGCTPVKGDFDNDGKSDLAVYEESSGYWYILNSGDYSMSSMKFGASGYDPVPADYDGDWQADIAVYHETSGYWYIWLSGSAALSSQKFGENGYSPVAGDYDGDGKADLAVYHESSGYWYMLLSESGTISYLKLGGPGYEPVGTR